MKRLVTVVVVLLVVAGIAYGGWEWYKGRGESAPQFRTGEARVGDVVSVITATGTIVPEDTIDVGAQVNGQIAEFGVGKDGKAIDYRSEVTEGQLLARIDEALYAADVSTAESQVAQAQAQLANAQAQVAQAQAAVRLSEANKQESQAKLTQAEADWARAQKLGPSDALAQADYDAIKSARDQAVAAIAVAEAQIGQGQAQIGQAQAQIGSGQAQIGIATANLTRAKRNLAYTKIMSPVSGVIIDKRVDVGQTVVASLNAPSLFLIAKDLRKMLVLVQVNEADIGGVEPGKAVTFTADAVPGRTFNGTVRKVRLNATMTQNVVTYTVEIGTENPDLKLLPYLTANVTFETARRDKVLTVPNAALRFTPSGGAAVAVQTAPVTGERPVGRNGAGGANGGGGGGGGRRDGGGPRGTVWVLDAAGQPKAVRVKTGLTDGVVTEVQSDELHDGEQVIIGQTNATARAGGDATNPFAPPMRRR